MPRIGTMIRETYRRPGVELLPQHLEARYGFRIAGWSRLDAGVFRVDRDDRPAWVARMFVSSRPLRRAEADAEVLRSLERGDVPAERLAHPEPVSELSGCAVLVTEFVDGKPVRDTPANCRRLGDRLGQVHALPTESGATQRAAGSLHHLPVYEGGPEQDLAAAAALLADLEGRVPAEHRRTYETLVGLLTKGDGAAGLPETFVHPDPARVNAIATPAGVVFVDWTGAGTGARLASLAGLLSSVGAQHAVDVLTGYSKHATLTAEELDRLDGVLWIRPLWLACWQCWLAVVSSKVNRAFVPDEKRITSTAAQVRAYFGDASSRA